jgi:hypothetical protein
VAYGSPSVEIVRKAPTFRAGKVQESSAFTPGKMSMQPFPILFHLLAQTEWPHVGPYVLDVSQAFLLSPGLAGILPAEGVLSLDWPDRVLLFVVDDYPVDPGIFLLIPIHDASFNTYRTALTHDAKTVIRAPARHSLTHGES